MSETQNLSSINLSQLSIKKSGVQNLSAYLLCRAECLDLVLDNDLLTLSVLFSAVRPSQLTHALVLYIVRTTYVTRT